eukprot:GHVT01020992.1.p1 GENE.GHVT01020992.1~~GHVT01020992.1.p1  ORF type:complete len:179 (+),score=16.16 GHVT01020992.1:303-839(+)
MAFTDNDFSISRRPRWMSGRNNAVVSTILAVGLIAACMGNITPVRSTSPGERWAELRSKKAGEWGMSRQPKTTQAVKSRVGAQPVKPKSQSTETKAQPPVHGQPVVDKKQPAVDERPDVDVKRPPKPLVQKAHPFGQKFRRVPQANMPITVVTEPAKLSTLLEELADMPLLLSFGSDR